MRSLPVTALICLSLLAACASPVTAPSLTPQESTRPSPAPSAVSTPAPPATSPSPTAAEADVLAHGSARDVGLQIRMAPGPDGTVFVSIPQDGGSLLALLDATGVPRPGWPIVVKDTSWCNNVLPVADGSVRVVCSLDDETSRQVRRIRLRRQRIAARRVARGRHGLRDQRTRDRHRPDAVHRPIAR